MAKRTLLDLANSLDRRADKLDQAASDAAVEVAVILVSKLTAFTPVDTSNALSNWQVGLGAPVDDTRRPYFWGTRGSTAHTSAMATIAAAKAVLSGKKPGEVIFISNSVDYIMDLERGTSEQAPNGFMDISLALTRKDMRKIRLKV
jgi:hypothetical protein